MGTHGPLSALGQNALVRCLSAPVTDSEREDRARPEQLPFSSFMRLPSAFAGPRESLKILRACFLVHKQAQGRGWGQMESKLLSAHLLPMHTQEMLTTLAKEPSAAQAHGTVASMQ